MNAPCVPRFPPRNARPVPGWRGFFGERARTAVYGWSQLAFESWYFKRRVLGHNVHVPLHPDLVQRVLLDNAAIYVKPALVKKLLSPTIGEGLLRSDGDLWREQRRIVAANFAPAAIVGLVPAFAHAAAWRYRRPDRARQDLHGVRLPSHQQAGRGRASSTSFSMASASNCGRAAWSIRRTHRYS